MENFIDRPIRKSYKDGSVLITNIRNPYTNQPTTYLVTNLWFDNSPMDDSKVDDFGIFSKYKPTGEYVREALDNWGEGYLQVDSIVSFRDIDERQQFLLYIGYYKGVSVSGYWNKNDTPGAIRYYLTDSENEDDGGNIIVVGNLKFEHDFNGYVNVKYFGAKGDFNNYTLNGSDDTFYFQNAINYLNRLGTVRKGNPRIIFSPRGNYLIDSLIAEGYDQMGNNLFGITFTGDARGCSMWSFDDRSTAIGLNCGEEAPVFRDINFNASRYFNASWSDPRKPIVLKFKKWSKHADIDVHFENCQFSSYNNMIALHGRGITMNGCTVGMGTNFINLQCDEDIVFLPSNQDTTGTQGIRTGFRHFNFSNNRLDACGIFMKIEGNGQQKDYINGVTFTSNVALVSDVLLLGEDATIHGLVLQGNDFRSSFRGGAIRVKSLFNAQDIGNNYYSKFDPDVSSMVATDGMEFVYRCKQIHGLTFSSHVHRLTRTAIEITEQGSNVNVTASQFSKFLELLSVTSGYVIFCPTKIKGLIISNNVFESNGLRTNYQVCNNSQFPNDKYFFENNVSNFIWSSGDIQKNIPKIFAGNSQFLGAIENSQIQFKIDGNFIIGQVQLSISPAVGDSGTLTVELPIPAIPSNNNLSGSYCGNAIVEFTANVPSNVVLATVQPINAVTDRIELKKNVSGSISNLVVSDLDQSKANHIYLSFKYRYK